MVKTQGTSSQKGRPHRMAQNSLDALKPHQWKKGQSGNAGRVIRPKVTFTATLLEILDAPMGSVPWPKDKLTWRQTLTLSWVKRAITEGLLFKEMLERTDGKVITPVALDLHTEVEKVAKDMGLQVDEVMRELEVVLKGTGQ